ncbi:MAG: dockerin type I domain-containing protein, partial [Prevotella sp.]|nr:dockerin type I domain-containing protein [Prevotella sp.]
PESVTSIGKWAFFECEKLNEITILNPYCEIYDSSETICNEDYYNYGSYNQYFTGTIYGYENSTAQVYAEKYGKNFESLGQAPEKITELGDINGDSLINAVDSTIVLVEYAELSTSNTSTLTETQKKSADVNNDDSVNAVDATIISQYYAHISTGGTMKFPKFIETLESDN